LKCKTICEALGRSSIVQTRLRQHLSTIATAGLADEVRSLAADAKPAATPSIKSDNMLIVLSLSG
jgi:hypothetical protein